MATEVAPSSVVELTELGKCLMKHEVGTTLLIPLLLSLLWEDVSVNAQVHCCGLLVLGLCSPELLSVPLQLFLLPSPQSPLPFSLKKQNLTLSGLELTA